MAESSSYLAGATPTYTITNENGSAVTPQEVYDAFMSGPVILELAGIDYHEEVVASSLLWVGTSSTTVVGVELKAIGIASGNIKIQIGEVGG